MNIKDDEKCYINHEKILKLGLIGAGRIGKLHAENIISSN